MLQRGNRVAALAAVMVLIASVAFCNEARVLDSSDSEILIELATDDYSLEDVVIGGESYVRVEAARLDETGEAGLPWLPMKAVLVGIPFGSSPALEVVSVESENLGAQRVLPFPRESFETDGEFTIPTQTFFADEEYYGRGGAYPAAVAELGAQGTLRHQRVLRVALHPFQYSPRSGTLTLHRRIVVRVTFGRTELRHDLTEAVAMEPEWERTYTRTILNHDQAEKWRRRPAPRRAHMRSELRRQDELYRVLTTESGMHRLDFGELAAEGLDSSTPVGEVAVFQRSYDAELVDPFVETPLAIVVVDEDEDGFFDDSDYLLFHALSFEQQHMPVGYEDRYGDENAYWFAHDPELAERMDTRPGWLDETGLDRPVSFRDTLRFEEEVYFDRTPEYDHLDLYHWTNNSAGGDNYRLPFHIYDPMGEIRMRARFQGVAGGFHTIDLRVQHDQEDNYIGQFTFSGVSQSMAEDIYLSGVIPPSYFANGDNVLQTIGAARASGANLDWFEFGYDRFFVTRDGRLQFTNAEEQGLTELQVTSFGTDELRLFDTTDPFGTVELKLGPENLSGGSGDYTLTLQDDVGQPFVRYEAVESGSFFDVTDVARREPANLFEDEADVIVVSYDNFAGGVQSLIEHRESQGWRVAHALVSEVYDEFGGGLKSLQALKNYFDYAFDEWDRTPQFVMLVGDANEDTRGLTDTNPVDFIPTVLGHGGGSYPQMTASDQWFISSDEGPLYLPKMFIGRLSVGGSGQLSTIVSKILSYEEFSSRQSWRSNVLFLADDQWNYASPGSDYRWNWSERDFTNISLELSEMVADSPAGIDTTLFMLRRYTDPYHEANGIGHNPQPYFPYFYDTFNFVRSEVTPEAVARLTEGAAIVNFQGHGNRSQMTHEVLLRAPGVATQNDIQDVDNDGKPFIFMGFSCHLSQFHYYDEGAAGGVESIVEQMLFLPSGRGAVAGFACAGAAYLSDNTVFNRAIFESFFTNPVPDGPPEDWYWPRWTLGSILGEGTVRFTIADGNSRPDRTYVLLGDPLLHLSTSPPTVRVTMDGEPLVSGEYLEATEPVPVTFVADIIDEVEIDPASIVLEETDIGIIDSALYTVEAVSDTASEVGRWYRLTYSAPIREATYDLRIFATDLSGHTGTFVAHVAEGSQAALELEDLASSPNPFSGSTKIIFQLNQSGADATVDIYTVGGRLIRTLEATTDLNYNEIEWDGTDADGDRVANGLYLFVLEVTGEGGSRVTTQVQRVVKTE